MLLRFQKLNSGQSLSTPIFLLICCTKRIQFPYSRMKRWVVINKESTKGTARQAKCTASLRHLPVRHLPVRHLLHAVRKRGVDVSLAKGLKVQLVNYFFVKKEQMSTTYHECKKMLEILWNITLLNIHWAPTGF